MKNNLALYHEQRSVNFFTQRSREPWENASEKPSCTALKATCHNARKPSIQNHLIKEQKRNSSAFFQDANYHDQIVKEQNEPAVHQAPTARDPDHSGNTHCWVPPWTEVRPGRPERASTHGNNHKLRNGPTIHKLAKTASKEQKTETRTVQTARNLP